MYASSIPRAILGQVSHGTLIMLKAFLLKDFLLFDTAPVDVAHNIARDVQMAEIIQQYLMCIRITKVAAASVHINSQL